MAKVANKEAAAEKSPKKSAPAVASMVEELPRAIVRRVVKDKLSQLATSSSSFKRNDSKEKGGGEGEGEDVSVQRDALIAFGESARIFIHYLSATANDICKDSKRQTINADDVLKAIEEIEFPEFIEPLKASLDEYRRKNATKRSVAKTKATGSEKKRKKSAEEEPTQKGEDVEEGAHEEDEQEGSENPDEK